MTKPHADDKCQKTPDEKEVQEKLEKGRDKDRNPLAPPINIQGGS